MKSPRIIHGVTENPYQGTVYLVFTDVGFESTGPTVYIFTDRKEAIKYRDKQLKTYRHVWAVAYECGEEL